MATKPAVTNTMTHLPVEAIQSKDGFNPRGADLGDITDLTAQVARHGVVSPVTVCKSGDGEHFWLIAGARRLAAATAAGLATVPAVVRADLDIDSPEAEAIAIVENDDKGRQGLPPVALARAYRHMMDRAPEGSERSKAKWVAKLLGRDQGLGVDGGAQHVLYTIKLLDTPDDIQALVGAGRLSKGAAVALTAADPETLGVVASQMAAATADGKRVTEEEVKRLISTARGEAQAPQGAAIDPAPADGAPVASEAAQEPAGARRAPSKAELVKAARASRDLRDQMAADEDTVEAAFHDGCLAGLLYALGRVSDPRDSEAVAYETGLLGGDTPDEDEKF